MKSAHEDIVRLVLAVLVSLRIVKLVLAGLGCPRQPLRGRVGSLIFGPDMNPHPARPRRLRSVLRCNLGSVP